MFQYINPIYILKKLFKMAKELNNLFFYHKTLNDMQKRNVFKFYDLRINRLNKIYTFINLPTEFLIMDNKVELDKHEREFIGNEMLKYMRPFEENHLYELYQIKYVRVKTETYYGYKVTFNFKFREVTFLWCLWLAAYVLIVWKLLSCISLAGMDHGIRSVIKYFKSL